MRWPGIYSSFFKIFLIVSLTQNHSRIQPTQNGYINFYVQWMVTLKVAVMGKERKYRNLFSWSYFIIIILFNRGQGYVPWKGIQFNFCGSQLDMI